MEFKEIVMKNLQYLRKQKNLSSEKVASVLNLSRQAYSNYENGTREISAESLKILASFYGTTLDLITSSNLIDAVQPVVSFQTVTNIDGNLEFISHPTNIANISSTFIVVKLRDNLTKVFETNMSHVNDHEMLFEYHHKLYISKVHFFDKGDGFFYYNDKPIYFSKEQSKSLIFIGMLLAKIEKEYDNNYFF
ncbi:helix-turn-helix transcriptional regulator [Acholeplasma laidlawii]|uniref:helix-turn-helix domain-containing protein n=1 Tax=Acholeplasma laidlawii TaxID=2148 RepID=UPI0018C24EEE|nr:helix-turn-helix transcriptional regulator [Acholeplasma laidlawii]MBG0763097.1 helix-turn-helix transcriptional regulator [Acholeplasma laidlawii]